MIDVDLMEEQLARALTGMAPPAAEPPAPVPAPTPAPARAATAPRRAPRRPGPPAPSLDGPALLELGLIDEAEAAMAGATDRRDALTWANMRALLHGQRDAVAAGLERLAELVRAGEDREAWNRYWTQRFWAAYEWGSGDERLQVLDHCREQAYRFDNLSWWGNLALLLTAMGKHDEATRAYDDAFGLLDGAARDTVWLDALTNLLEAAALLGDSTRVAACHRLLRWPEGRLVVVGHGVVCKGSVDRYRGLGLAALGRPAQAEECFRRAESQHREIGAGPLLARTRATGSAAA